LHIVQSCALDPSPLKDHIVQADILQYQGR